MEAQTVHVVILCDTTGSMGAYISSLGGSISQISAIIKLLYGSRAVIHLVAYEDSAAFLMASLIFAI